MFLIRDIKLAKDASRAGVSAEGKTEKGTGRREGWYAFTRRLMTVSGGREKKQLYRTVCIVCLIVGATTGAQLGRFGVWAALWCAMGVKVGILGVVACWRADEGESVSV